MSVQFIEQNGKPEWAVLPYQEYLRLVEKAELLEDIHDYDVIKKALEEGEEELVPIRVVDALIAGEHPVKVWRDYRRVTQEELATAVGISVPYLSQLESKKRKGSVQVLKALAKALNVTLDDITQD